MQYSRKKESRKFYLKNRNRILKNVAEYRKKNVKKLRIKARRKYATNKSYRDGMKAYQVEYRKKNRDKIYAYQRIYRSTKLKEWHNTYARKWMKTPKGKSLSQLKSYRRRSSLKNIGNHSIGEWKELKKIYKYRCAICNKKKKLTKDHIRALTKKGKNTIDNIQPLCSSCNSRKGNK